MSELHFVDRSYRTLDTLHFLPMHFLKKHVPESTKNTEYMKIGREEEAAMTGQSADESHLILIQWLFSPAVILWAFRYCLQTQVDVY